MQMLVPFSYSLFLLGVPLPSHPYPRNVVQSYQRALHTLDTSAIESKELQHSHIRGSISTWADGRQGTNDFKRCPK